MRARPVMQIGRKLVRDTWPAGVGMAFRAKGPGLYADVQFLQSGRDHGGEARADAADAEAHDVTRGHLGDESLGRLEIHLRIDRVIGVSLRNADLHPSGQLAGWNVLEPQR